ncbi:hypothetical protein [Achromobacter sp. GbtcB20]|uniref:hypothetical protein n=1 Tax=Achromobacter sp. GbtcB20 TaxID=2824765 RepID=UPI001D0F6D08|nr:hypothetical protein [Achromobacter sp. GbtcB20]
MRKTVIGALLLTAVVAAPAHAAFTALTIDCKTLLGNAGKEEARPVQWRWDGSVMSTTYTTYEREVKTTSFKPIQFVQRDTITGLIKFDFGFVTGILPNGDRQARTYQVFERNDQLFATETWSVVTPEGVVLYPSQNEYRNCS